VTDPERARAILLLQLEQAALDYGRSRAKAAFHGAIGFDYNVEGRLHDVARKLAALDAEQSTTRAAYLKHGPGGTGLDGPCDPDCAKRRAEVLEKPP
jgi:hypothetical protein